MILEDLSHTYDKADPNSPAIDAIIVSGDFVVHGLSSKNLSVSNWPQQKVIIQQVLDSISLRFPGVPLIPNIGNNDAINHYQAPNGTNKELFYSDLYTMWFSNYSSMTQDP